MSAVIVGVEEDATVEEGQAAGKRIVCTDATFHANDTSIDIVSFDIGTINMGVARVRFDYASNRLCILNAMLLNIFNPFQMLNENDVEHDETTTFPVAAFYATAPQQSEIVSQNAAFSRQQLLSRKRARVCERNDQTLQFATDSHPHNVAKRRRTKLNQSQIPATLADNWSLIGAQLASAIGTHQWMSDLQNIDFILIEQQDRENPKARAICMSLVTFFETKRQLAAPVRRPRPTPEGRPPIPLQTCGPFIKICSASNKLAHATTHAMRQHWTMESVQSHNITPAQVKALLKKHFVPPSTDVANTATYAKRKISSKDEITSFFCQSLITRARVLTLQNTRSLTLPLKCDDQFVQQVAGEPVNAYAHWIVNQLGEKNNVTDALLQAFSWLQQCDAPSLHE